MKLEKYHGLGNDFLITLDQSFIGDSEKIISLCNRYSGIGADGFIVVRTNPLEMIFYNQDGTRGEMCGNGIRCFSMFCYNNGLIDSDEFDVVTLDGVSDEFAIITNVMTEADFEAAAANVNGIKQRIRVEA